MNKKLITISTALATVLLFSGCLSLRFGGGGRKTVNENKTEAGTAGNVTLGQQLIDLKKACDAGLISEREYNKQRKELLRHQH